MCKEMIGVDMAFVKSPLKRQLRARKLAERAATSKE